MAHIVTTAHDSYKLLDEIGNGTFSVVHKARRACDGEMVAIKCLRPHNLDMKRAYEELKCIKKLCHENIVGVLDAAKSEDSKKVFFVMRLFEHDHFETALAAGRFTEEHMRAYMRGLFDALDHIHSREYIHRDIKPNNVLYHFGSKRTLVVDFGLVQRLKASCPDASTDSQKATCACGSNSAASASASAASIAATAPIGDASASAAAPPAPLHQLSAAKLQRQPSRAAAPAPNKGQQLLRDALPSWEAARDGTRGFRAPEVLMGCPDQTAAIDVWSAAVILLCLLTKRYPIFEAHNDAHALVEIAEALPKEEVLEGTKALDRVITVMVDGTSRAETGWVRRGLCDSDGKQVSAWGRDLLDKCLRFNPAKRLSAPEASKYSRVDTAIKTGVKRGRY